MRLDIPVKILTVLCAAWVGCASSVAIRPLAGPDRSQDPVLGLWVRRPLLDLCHVLSANALVYPSRRIIYLKEGTQSEPARYLQVTLSVEEYDRLLGQKQFAALSMLGDDYFVTEGTEASDYVLRWSTVDGARRQVVVTGILERNEGSSDRERAPAAFLVIFDALAEFVSSGSIPYEPESVEVWLSPLRNPEAGAVTWPAAWPKPIPNGLGGEGASGMAVSRISGVDFATVFKDVCVFQQSVQAVDIDGVSYYFLGVRAALPGGPDPLKYGTQRPF